MKNKRLAFIGPLLLTLVLCLSQVAVLGGADADSKLVAGSKLDGLTIGGTTYTNVVIRSVSAHNAVITHDGGMKSLVLHDLPPDLQQRFNYNPEADRAQDAAAKASQAAAEQKQKERIEAVKKSRESQVENKYDQLIASFGEPPEICKLIDLRSKYNDYGLWVKDQGHRPSCAVFAIVSTLEFEYAEQTGTPTQFSEEYLLWATAKTLGRPVVQQRTDTDDPKEKDVGFLLTDVVTAYRRFGCLPQSRMPNHKAGAIEPPSPELIGEAQNKQRVNIVPIPGNDQQAVCANIIQALNMGFPVPIGMRWVQGRQTWHSGFIDQQTPDENSAHAVTIVGYKCDTGRIEDVVFTFKNSWGVKWGVNGYGQVTNRYLSQNIYSAVVLELGAR